MSRVDDGIYSIPVGWLDLPRSDIFGGGDRSIITIPVTVQVLIKPDRVVLVDTGSSPAAIADAEAAWGIVGRRVRPHARDPDPLLSGLAKLGLDAGDVTDVVQTHLHMDHTGGLRAFASARIWVQASELRWALYPNGYSALPYIADEIDPRELSYRVLDGDAEIDEDVAVYLTPGHTPGHQSVLLRSGGQWQVIVGDVSYTADALRSKRYGGSMWNAEEWWRSRARILTLERCFGAQIVIPHDPAQFESDDAPWPITGGAPVVG